MSRLAEILQFADTQFQRKKEDRRYTDQRNMQLAAIAQQKDKENKIFQSQRFLNDAVKLFSAPTWEDGKYVGHQGPNESDIIDSYLNNMNNLGLAGDRMTVQNTLKEMKNQRFIEDSNKVTGLVAQWEAANKGRLGDDGNPFTKNTYKESRQKFLKEIGADTLFSNVLGTTGAAQATQLTMLTPEDFTSAKEPISKMALGAGGVGVTGGTLWAGSKIINSMNESIKAGDQLLVDKGKGKEALTKLNAELDKLKKSGSAEAKKQVSKMKKLLGMINKRGYVDTASMRVLHGMNKDIPLEGEPSKAVIKKGKEIEKAKKALDNIKKPTMTSRALKLVRNQLPFLAPLIGAKIDDTLELEAPAAETAGAVIMGAAQKPSFYKFVGKAMPKIASKAMVLAAADGPLFFGDLLAVGLTTVEVAMLLSKWKEYSEK